MTTTAATALIQAELAALMAQAQSQMSSDKAIPKIAELLTILGVDHCVVMLKDNNLYILLQCGGAVTVGDDVCRVFLPIAGSTRQGEFPLRGSLVSIAITVSVLVEGRFGLEHSH